MMTADDFTAATDTGATEVAAPELSQDDAMNAAWEAMHADEPEEGQERGDDGKFKGKGGDTETAELEGAAEGEEGEEGNSAVTETAIPLPSNLYGLDDVWAGLPVETQQKLAERTNELNSRMSDMGRQVSQAKPLMEVADKFSQYFNGNLKHPDGATVTPASAVEYLFGIQAAMDKDAPSTLMSIIDTYGARDKIAQMLGVQAAPQQQQDNRLLSEIAALKQEVSSLKNPENITKVLDQRETNSEISRLLSSEPLTKEIPENRLAFFISEGWDKLGGTASRKEVLDYAVKAAIEADPALRAKTQAALKAATGDKQKAEAAKRATGVNVTSTSSGKARTMSDDEAMTAKWAELGLN